MNDTAKIPPVLCGGKVLEFGIKTLVMGIVNVTPDSFSGDGLALDPVRAVERGLRLVEEGADLLDIGGESTRPGSEPVPVEEELRRVLPVIEQLSDRVSTPLSIDTCKSAVARAATQAGATLINDISAMNSDPEMSSVAAETRAGLVLMHMQGTPRTMQKDPHYGNLMQEIMTQFRKSIVSATQAGVSLSQIILDPGIGFGKTVDHNLEILKRLSDFRTLGRPVLIGPSRKSFIGKVLDLPVGERLEGTAACIALAIANGADIVRVHDVKIMARVARMSDAIARGMTRGGDTGTV